MRLTTAQRDRVCGVLLAAAAGDALGAGYEFGPALPDDTQVAMIGGGGFDWAPGEWTDDTAMAIAIAEAAATGADLRGAQAQDAIVKRWHQWSRRATDVGAQTRAVLDALGRDPAGHTAASAYRESRWLHERTGHTAGNGSLMRTGPVALAHLNDEDGLIQAATALSTLTHYDPEAAQACVLWCLAIRHAVLTGDLDLWHGLPRLSPEARSIWAERIEAAESHRPADFTRNGWVVQAFQGAWSAITTTPVPDDNLAAGTFRADHLRLALQAAVRGGNDTDTVAAIAGSLLGAAYGASAVPAQWRRLLHGWPGWRTRDLVEAAGAIARHGAPDGFDFSYRTWSVDTITRHPYDDGVWLGGIGALRELPPKVDAVVSLCRVGDGDLPGAGVEHVEVRLIDDADPEENPHLGFVLHDTASLIAQLRNEGHTVLVHCVQAQSRTPTVAALYGMRLRGVSAETALSDVIKVLPAARPIEGFRAALRQAHDSDLPA